MKQVLEKYLSVIKHHHPNATLDRIELLSSEGNHYVYLVADTIFRFPKTEKQVKNDTAEVSFFKHFKNTSTIKIPNIIMQFDKLNELHYQVYQYIPGVPLNLELVHEIGENASLVIAATLGKFLASLHAFPRNDIRHIDLDTVDIDNYAIYFKDILSEDKKVLGKFITENEWKWIEKNNINFYHLVKDHPFKPRIIHGDLLARHILVDEHNYKLNGIIDFSVKIADPAFDFRIFNQYGKAFLQTAYDNYLQIDNYFDERRKFYARDLFVVNLYNAIQRNDLEIEKYREELKQVIATNPL